MQWRRLTVLSFLSFIGLFAITATAQPGQQPRGPTKPTTSASSSTSASASASAAIPTASAQPAAPPARQRSLIDHPTLAATTSTLYLANTPASGATTTAQSIDVSILVGVIRDKAAQAGLRAIADLLKNVPVAPEYRHFVEDLFDRVARLLTNRSGVDRDAVEAVALAFVRMGVAEALVQTTFPTTTLLDPSTWANRLQWKPDATVDAKKLRGYIVGFTYEALGKTELLRAASFRAPICPFDGKKEVTGAALCTELEGLATRDVPRLLTATNVGYLVDALRIAANLKNRAAVHDLLQALLDSDVIATFGSTAAFGATTGLDLDKWLTYADDVQTIALSVRSVLGVGARIGNLASELKDYEPKVGPKATLTAASADLLAIVNSAQFTSSLTALFGAKAAANIVTELKTWADAAGKLAKGTAAPSSPNADALALLDLMPQSDAADLQQSAADFRKSALSLKAALTQFGAPLGSLDLGKVKTSGLSSLITALTQTANALQTISTRLASLGGGSTALTADLGEAQASVTRLTALLRALSTAIGSSDASGTIGGFLDTLRVLGLKSGGDTVAPLLDLVGPVLSTLRDEGKLTPDAVLLIAVNTPPSTITMVLGSCDSPDKVCADEPNSAACLAVTVLGALKQAIGRDDGGHVKIDGAKLAEAAAALGDDYRRRDTWHPFFHLSIGVGSLYSAPPVVTTTTSTAGATASVVSSGDPRGVPLVAEQIGFGYASPTLFGDTATFKVGAFGSGLLYRIVIDSTESKAVAGGLFVALDLYESIELYVAGQYLFYPPIDGQSIHPRPAFSAGLQVPLADYLSKVTR